MLLPQPLAPTRAVVFPAGIDRFKLYSTVQSGLDGYAKWTFRNSILPSTLAGAVPDFDRGSRREGLSMTPKSSDAAADAFMKANNCGANWEVALAAIVTERTTLTVGQRSAAQSR